MPDAPDGGIKFVVDVNIPAAAKAKQVGDSFKQMGDSATTAGDKIKMSEEQMRSMADQMSRAGLATNQIEASLKKMGFTGAQINQILTQMGRTTQATVGDMHALGGKVHETTGLLDKLGMSWGTIKNMMMGLLAYRVVWGAFGAIASGLKSIVSTGIEFEAAFARVKAVSQSSAAEIQNLRTELLELTKTLPITVTELAGLAKKAEQLGIATKDVANFTEVIARFSMVSGESFETTADNLGKFMNNMGTAPELVDKVASTILYMGITSASTENEVAKLSFRLSGAAGVLKMTNPQVIALAGSLASLGIRAEMGGTAIQRVLMEMAKAVANGGEKLKQFAAVAGMSIGQFAKLMRVDAGEAFMAFMEGLAKMRDDGITMIKVLDDMDISQVRMLQALLRLSGGMELYRKAIKGTTEEYKNGRTAMESSGKAMDTTKNSIDLMNNAWDRLSITLWEKVAPAFRSWFDGVTDFLNSSAYTKLLALINFPAYKFMQSTKPIRDFFFPGELPEAPPISKAGMPQIDWKRALLEWSEIHKQLSGIKVVSQEAAEAMEKFNDAVEKQVQSVLDKNRLTEIEIATYKKLREMGYSVADAYDVMGSKIQSILEKQGKLISTTATVTAMLPQVATVMAPSPTDLITAEQKHATVMRAISEIQAADAVSAKIATVQKEIMSGWEKVAQSMEWSMTYGFGDILSKAEDFRDGMHGIFRSIKQACADMVAGMISSWIMGFIRPAMGAFGLPVDVGGGFAASQGAAMIAAGTAGGYGGYGGGATAGGGWHPPMSLPSGGGGTGGSVAAGMLGSIPGLVSGTGMMSMLSGNKSSIIGGMIGGGIFGGLAAYGGMGLMAGSGSILGIGTTGGIIGAGAMGMGIGAAVALATVLIIKALTKDAYKSGATEIGRDFGGVSTSAGMIQGFLQEVGLSKKSYAGIRKDIASSPKWLTEYAYPLAQKQGKVAELLRSLESVSTAWGTFNFRPAFEEWMRTGDASSLNRAFIAAFSQSQALQSAMPDFATRLAAQGSDSSPYGLTRHKVTLHPVTPTGEGSTAPLTIINNFNIEGYYDKNGARDLFENEVAPILVNQLEQNSPVVNRTIGLRVAINKALK